MHSLIALPLVIAAMVIYIRYPPRAPTHSSGQARGEETTGKVKEKEG